MDHQSHPSHHHPHQPHHQQQQHHQQQHQHQLHPSHAMHPPNSSPYPTSHMISTPNYINNHNRLPFNSSPVPTPPPPPQTTPSNPIQSLEPLSSPYSGSGSGDGSGGGHDIDPNSQKKKRGRPRKYSPDNGGGGGYSIDLGLSPSSDDPTKKNRGRPSGSSKKQLDALGNCGVGFTPHVILVNAGEDIAAKILAFSKQGARTVCVLSANGSICNVDLRQPAMSGGVVKYEGQYEIISLSGSFLFSENRGGQAQPGGLSVSLAGTDGRVLGGGVVGVLRAATPVQIIVGSFIADGKKPKYMPSVTKSSFCAQPQPQAQAQPLAAVGSSPPSQEVSTEESEEKGSDQYDMNMGSYAHSNHPIHHNMQMNWPNPASNILPN